MKRMSLLILIAAGGLVVAGFAQAPVKPQDKALPGSPAEAARKATVVAEGGDFKVTVDDIERSFTNIPPQFLEHFNDPGRKENYILEFVNKIVFAKEAQARGYLNRERIRRQIEDYTRTILYTELSKDVTDNIFISNEEVQKYYDEHRMSYAMPERVKARHILVKTEADAAAVQAELDKWADWNELARKYSQDKATSNKGGDLGFIRKGDMDLDFEKAAFALEAGKTEGPIKTRSGFEFVRVEMKKPTEILPLESVKNSILNRLTAEKKAEILARTKDELAKKYGVVLSKDKFDSVQPTVGKPAGSSGPGAPASRPRERQPLTQPQ
ncbi:MAG: peptidyl-prolyl cis-trans isomerase [Acidobacteria bacterium]|nr:peptidyl-prolyl cis-trans isomerase [Acidobacteriota bacterium]